MLFSSISFLYYFLPLTLVLYFLVPKRGKKCGSPAGKPDILRVGRAEIRSADGAFHSAGIRIRTISGKIQGKKGR